MKSYRQMVSGWAFRARLTHRQTDLFLLSDEPLDPAPGLETLRRLWCELETYMARHPVFRMSLEPLEPLVSAPAVATRMCLAGEKAGVGPMAAVAGAFAEEVCLAYGQEMAAENGGDVFIRSRRERAFQVFTGNPRIPSLGFALPPGSWGAATSSGKIGPSLSLGRSFAATVVAESGALADAWATRLGNEAWPGRPAGEAIRLIKGQPGVLGALLVSEDEVAVWNLKIANPGP